MPRFDIAIHGRGLLPPLLALHMLNARPDLTVLLLCADQTVGGEQLEPVIVDRLGEAARTLVEPFVVTEWPGYFIARYGKIDRFDEVVWLLDPVQVSLELEDRDRSCWTIPACGTVNEQSGRISWNGVDAETDQLIDLSGLTWQQYESEILGIEAVRQLGLPILADYDTATEGWEANQLLPLGDERVLVRKLPRRGDLFTTHTGFEGLLNALISD